MKRLMFAGALIVLPSLASAQEVVSDPKAQALIQQEIGIQQQVLTELKIIVAQNSVPPAQRAIVADKIRQQAAAKAAAASQDGAATTSTGGVASIGDLQAQQ